MEEKLWFEGVALFVESVMLVKMYCEYGVRNLEVRALKMRIVNERFESMNVHSIS